MLFWLELVITNHAEPCAKSRHGSAVHRHPRGSHGILSSCHHFGRAWLCFAEARHQGESEGRERVKYCTPWARDVRSLCFESGRIAQEGFIFGVASDGLVVKNLASSECMSDRTIFGK